MVTYFLIGLISLSSFVAFRSPKVFSDASFSPSMIRSYKDYYRFFTYSFLHGDVGHLFFNMITLYFFGTELEKILNSPLEFMIFFLSASAVSVLPSFRENKKNPQYICVGASGAVSAVVFYLVLYTPWDLVYIHFIIPLYFILYAIGYLTYSSYMSNKKQDNVAHDVHLWGALYGIAYALIIHPHSLRIFLNQIVSPPFID